MRGDGGYCFLEVVILLELRGVRGRGIDNFGVDDAVLGKVGAGKATHLGILGNSFGGNIARALQRGRNVRHVLLRINEGSGDNFGHVIALREQELRQRLQATLAGNHRARPAFGAIGQVDILKLGTRLTCQNARFQLIGQLSLLDDGCKHRLATRLQFAVEG